MAEFQEVCKHLKRMCEQYGNGCIKCPLVDKDFCSLSAGDRTAETYKQAEEIIMSWAAEHPEPVYPAWRDWLRDLYGNPQKTMTDILESPIDPEIAQRLNIVPRRAR